MVWDKGLWHGIRNDRIKYKDMYTFFFIRVITMYNRA